MIWSLNTSEMELNMTMEGYAGDVTWSLIKSVSAHDGIYTNLLHNWRCIGCMYVSISVYIFVSKEPYSKWNQA